jgi:hypothetical protein
VGSLEVVASPTLSVLQPLGVDSLTLLEASNEAVLLRLYSC